MTGAHHNSRITFTETVVEGDDVTRLVSLADDTVWVGSSMQVGSVHVLDFVGI